MKNKTRILSIVFVVLMLLSLTACKKKPSDGETITISYQYGIAYLPIQIVKDYGLIEKHYDGSVDIDWIILNSGQAVNEAFIAGDIDVAALGVAPVIIGVSKGVDYKIFSGISSQPIELMTNIEGIHSLDQIDNDTKIGMGSLGSMQHIVLAMACKKELGDAHALDELVMPLSHPDAMNALLTGSVDYHVATPPYLFMEEEYEGVYAVESISKVWPTGNSFVVGVASGHFIQAQPELYQAVALALAEAVDYIGTNLEEVAEKYCEEQGISRETLLAYLNRPECIYDTQTYGVAELASFMSDNGFLDEPCPTEEELFSEAVY